MSWQRRAEWGSRYISPHSNKHPHRQPICAGRGEQTKRRGDLPTIFTASFGLLLGPVETFSILRSVSMPSTTFPNTTCLPSKKSHFAVVMKNCYGHRRKEKRKKKSQRSRFLGGLVSPPNMCSMCGQSANGIYLTAIRVRSRVGLDVKGLKILS